MSGGFRFYRRLKLFGGFGLNFTKTGVSWSVRTKGGSVSSKGYTFRTGIPGLTYIHRDKKYKSSVSGNSDNILASILAIIFLLFILLKEPVVNAYHYIISNPFYFIIPTIIIIIVIFQFRKKRTEEVQDSNIAEDENIDVDEVELDVKRPESSKPVVQAMGVIANSTGLNESNGSWYRYPELSLLKDHEGIVYQREVYLSDERHTQIAIPYFSIKEAFAGEIFRNSTYELPIILGKKDIIDNPDFNEFLIADLTKMPNLLIAGGIGEGKSTCINSIITSILYKTHPEDVKFILVDPKKVELSLYKHIAKHFLPELPDGQEAIITDTRLVIDVLKLICIEIDDRYDKLQDAGVRNIKEYNKKIGNGELDIDLHHHLPYLILVIDELAIIMTEAGNEVELPIKRIIEMGYTVGIHSIISIRIPTSNSIKKIIDINFQNKLIFRVPSIKDSKSLINEGGGELLMGNGDMIYYNGKESKRLQCPFIDTEEIDRLTKYIETQPYPENFRLNITNGEEDDYSNETDPMFEDAARMVVRTQQGSTAMLQRRLKLGYNRAGRVMDQLEKRGIVGKNEGSKAREVLFNDEADLEQFLSSIGK